MHAVGELIEMQQSGILEKLSRGWIGLVATGGVDIESVRVAHGR